MATAWSLSAAIIFLVAMVQEAVGTDSFYQADRSGIVSALVAYAPTSSFCAIYSDFDTISTATVAKP